MLKLKLPYFDHMMRRADSLEKILMLGKIEGRRFALETNSDHSVIFEIASKYCILDSFVDYDGYSISLKGFLPTVVDIMVI